MRTRPSLIEDATLVHDGLVVDCLSSILDRAHPSLFDEGPFDGGAYGQASLPVRQGGLGIGSAQVTSAPAYLAGWVDFLRFHHAHPSFLPELAPCLTRDALTTSQLPDILALRDTWSVLTSRLSRIDLVTGDLIGGEFEMQGALGSSVSSVADLVEQRLVLSGEPFQPGTPTLDRLNDAALTLASMLITLEEYKIMRLAILSQ